MTATQETITFTVDQPINTLEELQAVPIGGRIVSQTGARFTRVRAGYQPDGSERVAPFERFNLYGYNKVHSLPESSESEPARLERYTVLNPDHVDSLPVGTKVLNTSSGRTWTKTDEGHWLSEENTTATARTMRRRFGYGHVQYVEGLPEAPTSDSQVVDTTEQTPLGRQLTLEQYAQRFCTLMEGGHQQAGIGSGYLVERALHDELGIPKYEPMMGLSVCYTDGSLIAQIPVGSVLVTEGEPGDTHFTAYRKSEGSLLRILGDGAITGPAVVLIIDSIPDSDAKAPWVDNDGSESELAAIRQFRVKAWTAAMNVKSATGWCGELEQVVYRSGIDRSVGTQDTATELLTAEQVAELPAGSIVRYMSTTALIENARSRTLKTALYVRDDSADNPAKTRRIGGVLPGSWVPHSMEVVYRNDATVDPAAQTLAISTTSFSEMDSMPDGTQVGDGSTFYEKGHVDGAVRWTHVGSNNSTYVYNASQLGLNLLYRVIPV